jgi:hypothetical protein
MGAKNLVTAPSPLLGSLIGALNPSFASSAIALLNRLPEHAAFEIRPQRHSPLVSMNLPCFPFFFSFFHA